MITRVCIEGYKSIGKLDIELRPINILLGSNGVGKSNFISTFALLRNIYAQNLQNYIQIKGGADSLLHFGKTQTEEILLDFHFGDASKTWNRFILRLQEGQDSLFIKSIRTAFNGMGAGESPSWHYQSHEQNKFESQFALSKNRQAFWVNDYLKEFEVYHFHDTSDKSPIKAISDVNDNRKLKRDGSNIAAYLYYLQEKHPKHFQRIEKTIQSIAPFFDHFVLEPSRLNVNKIHLEWKERGFPDAYFNAYHLSDGTLRFICLTTLLMQPEPPVTIIIDEPELGLHPVAINKLAAMVRKVSSSKVQVILSTQSVNFIDNFDPEDIIVTDRDTSGSIFKRLDSQELSGWLKEYTLGDLWGKNIIGAQPYNK